MWESFVNSYCYGMQSAWGWLTSSAGGERLGNIAVALTLAIPVCIVLGLLCSKVEAVCNESQDQD